MFCHKNNIILEADRPILYIKQSAQNTYKVNE
jgi:hypothetical protein